MTRHNKSDRPRVVITGIGAMSPLGESPDSLWNGLVSGTSGIDNMTITDPSEFPCKFSGEVLGFDPTAYMDRKEARRMGRFSQFAVAAAQQALSHSGLDLNKEDRERMGVVLGNGSGGYPETEQAVRTLVGRGGMKISPFYLPTMLCNMAAANVSRLNGLYGYTNTIVTACAAGTQGIGEAAEAIRRGVADVIVSGGTEAGLCQLGQGGFNVIHALTRRTDDPTKVSRPFDADRDGFVPAEGAGVLILESLEHAINRGANILAEVLGQASSSDAFHLVQPDDQGAGAARAIIWAMEDAGVASNEVDYINAHGTSTPLNDLAETKAIKKAFGSHAEKVPVSSTKSMIGHALGAAGALEAIACIKSIETNTIHPTVNYETKDPECDLDYVPNTARQTSVDITLSNSFGFGGQNACLIIGRFNE
ncbi:MAG: beta-ketoacyl-[acyl-carrier-protein] synthase II [Dehalococcoidia bacterium]|nr:beta-ketoacyl-[acyl-carrier-protein] synthase II [Dehalococcoidia bacterium]|tara:strand:+ start:9818 stop:11080 length:1263 start_codon:yes stop_codon:yes gene_type:complete